MVEEGPTAAFCVCHLKWDTLEEPSIPTKDGKDVTISSAFRKRSDDVQVQKRKPFVWDRDLSTGQFDGLACLSHLTRMAGLGVVRDISPHGRPVVFGGNPPEKLPLATVIEAVVKSCHDLLPKLEWKKRTGFSP